MDASKLNFDKIFIIPITASKINRSNPYLRKDTKWAVQFTIGYTIFSFVSFTFIYNIIYHDIKNNDFMHACKNGTLIVVYCVTSFQYFISITHRKTIVSLIEDVKKDYGNTSSENLTIVRYYAIQAQWVCKQWLFLSANGVISFLLKSLVLIIFSCWEGLCEKVPLHDVVYPTFMEGYKDSFLAYLVLCSSQLYFGFQSCMIYSSFVPLGPIFMLHACGQLELVKRQVDVLFDGYDAVDVRRRLRRIVLHLQYIYRFVDKINECFHVTYEFILMTTAVILPVTVYEVLEAFRKGEISLEFLIFIVGGFLISSSPCYYGDLLMEKGEEVRQAIYSSGWEKTTDLRVRSTLLLLLTRTLRSTAVQTMFRTVSLDALTDVLRHSYAIFNLINAMWK